MDKTHKDRLSHYLRKSHLIFSSFYLYHPPCKYQIDIFTKLLPLTTLKLIHSKLGMNNIYFHPDEDDNVYCFLFLGFIYIMCTLVQPISFSTSQFTINTSFVYFKVKSNKTLLFFFFSLMLFVSCYVRVFMPPFHLRCV